MHTRTTTLQEHFSDKIKAGQEPKATRTERNLMVKQLNVLHTLTRVRLTGYPVLGVLQPPRAGGSGSLRAARTSARAPRRSSFFFSHGF